jgi:uncharacterized protein (DUF2132 family)
MGSSGRPAKGGKNGFQHAASPVPSARHGWAENACVASEPAHPTQARNPLHGLTLEAIVTTLQAHYGWEGLAERIPLRCFSSDPSVASSLKFLRKTPWAREKVEGLYLFMQREVRRSRSQAPGTSRLDDR